jgi:GntR family transcriptional regulator
MRPEEPAPAVVPLRARTADSAVGPAAEALRKQLAEQIHTGKLAAGTRLGGERELAAHFGVSRSTVRQALAALEAAGVVRRVPGRGGGTFITRPKFERDLSHIVGVPALLQQQGMAAGSRVMSTSIAVADENTAQALELHPGSWVVQIVRIRLADGAPLSLEHLHLPVTLFPGLLDLPLGGSVYDLLAEHYGVRAAEALERIEVVTAGRHESLILDVSAGAPLLSITRTTRSSAGVLFEYSHDLFRADRTRITVRTPGVPMSASGRAGGHFMELRARDAQ